MALNKDYFDAINIDVVKKKYYNANKVEAVFSDIRRQAEVLYAENEAMRLQLDALNGKKFEIGDAVLSAQMIRNEIMERANAEAKAIIAEAERRRDEIIGESLQQQEYAVQKVEACYTRMKEQHMACIDAINTEWQGFLCGLYEEDDAEPCAILPERAYMGAKAGTEYEDDDISLDDLRSKLKAIASDMFSTEDEDDPVTV